MITEDKREEHRALAKAPRAEEGSVERMTDAPGREVAEKATSTEEPDVLLHVPVVKVEELNLEVDELNARVSLHCAVGNLVSLDVGADVQIGRVRLGMKGVEAQALLKVRLENVYSILERTLTTIDRNPRMLESVLRPVGDVLGAAGRTVERAVPALGDTAGRALEKTIAPDRLVSAVAGTPLGQAVNQLGQAAGERVAEPVKGLASALTEPAIRAPSRNSPARESALGPTEGETLHVFDGTETSLEQWQHAGGGAVRYDSGQALLQAGEAPGLFYLRAHRLNDFDLKVEFRPEESTLMGIALRFREPTQPVADRADPERFHRYDNPALAATHTGFEVQLGSQRPDVEPGTFRGILFGTAAGAQTHSGRGEIAEGTWNEVEVRVRSDEYAVRLNGTETARFRNVDSFRGWPAARGEDAGFIGFVMRQGRMAVRRVELRTYAPLVGAPAREVMEKEEQKSRGSGHEGQHVGTHIHAP